MEDNSSLWRSLVVPEETEDWKSEALDLFDEKSRSILEEISLQSPTRLAVDHPIHLEEIIAKPRETLQSLWVAADWVNFSDVETILVFAMQLPKSTEFRVSNLDTLFNPSVRLVGEGNVKPLP